MVCESIFLRQTVLLSISRPIQNNLLSDPGEHSNVAEENKELVQKMRDELIRIVESGLHIQPGYFISK